MSKRNFRHDLLADAPELAAFYRYSIHRPDYGQMISDRRAIPLDRDRLVDDLLDQNRHFREAAPARANIEALRDPKTFTVTTGHQLSLMGGPMYMLYKIATVISLARHIESQQPDHKVVPVFWMATEDHDWEEINHYHPAFYETVTYGGTFHGPVGRHFLEPSIQEILSDIPADLRSCYAPGRSLADAFRQLILKLFGQYGLVVLDGDRPALKEAFVPWMERELRGQGMGQAVIETTARLEEMGYAAQVFPRALNLFYMGHGGRDLLFRDGDRLYINQGEQNWSVEEMVQMCRDNPSDFSPNVAMRPLYQEIILPNLAYTGGWAEVSYWHQLKAGFEAVGAFFPMVIPRMSATLYHPLEVAPLLTEGLSVMDAARDEHELFQVYQDRHHDTSAYEAVFSAMDAEFLKLAQSMESEEPTLVRTVMAERQRLHNFQHRLLKKWRKNRRNQNPAPFQALAAAKQSVQPSGIKQERYLNFTHFCGDDWDGLVDLIIAHCQPEALEEVWIPLS